MLKYTLSANYFRGVSLDYLAPLRSELKLSILLSLLDGNKKLSELKNEIKSRETSILHILKEFESINLTTKSSGTYSLTSLGFMEARICKNYYSTVEVLDKFKDFWLYHDVKPITSSLMIKMGALTDSTLIRSGRTELSRVYDVFLKLLMESKKVMGISPIFHPDYVPVIENLLSQGNSVELILTSDVLKKTLAATKLNLAKNFRDGTLKIYINEKLKLALTVTDKNFSLGLFTVEGEYDDKMDLISINQQAIQWGEELFQHKLKDSVSVSPEPYMERGEKSAN
jgi:predicted transcriptional regulator